METQKWRDCLICKQQIILSRKYFQVHRSDLQSRVEKILGQDVTSFVTSQTERICGPCHTKIVNIEKLEGLARDFRKVFTESHVDLKVKQECKTPDEKRLSCKRFRTSPSPSPYKQRPRKKLSFDISKSPCQHAETVNVHLPQHYLKAVTDIVVREVDALCKKDAHSLFERTDKDALKNWSYINQEMELKEKAPVFHHILQAVAMNEKSLKKNKVKTRETILPCYLSAVSTLLYCRNRNMNSHLTLTGLQLKRGGVTKEAIERLHCRGLSVSYRSIIRCQVALGKDFDATVKKWAAQMSEDRKVEQELRQKITNLTEMKPREGMDKRELCTLTEAEERLKQHLLNMHPGFKIVIDNVDLRISPRQMTRQQGNRDLHYCNVMAVKNKVSGSHLPNDAPIRKEMDLSLFVPSVQDNLELRGGWVDIIRRVLSDYLPAFSKPTTSRSHLYSKESCTKSEVIGLGVITENENTNEGMVRIMEYIKKYVPDSDTDNPIEILSGGDQLTCERQENTQEDRRDSSRGARWAGLIPVIEDFHALGNFYQVMWKYLYSTEPAGSRDVGTLYASRNFLKTHNVPVDPMKNFNACSELLDRYSDALIVTAALEFFGMESTKGRITSHIFDGSCSYDEYSNDAIGHLIDDLAICSVPLSTLEKRLKCPECGKTYQQMNTLKRHFNKHHKGMKMKVATPEDPDKDTVRNYSCVALGFCLLVKDFQNARRCGDGDRIILLYKFMMLHFRAAGKSKYAYHTLRALAQQQHFLTPRMAHQLKWNRFVNLKGQVDTNVEMDRSMEHKNKLFKQECRSFHGKVTEASVARVGQAAHTLDQILYCADKAAKLKKSSGKHTKKDTNEDVLALVQLMHQEEVFKLKAGRRLHAFPDFPRNTLAQLDQNELHKWMTTTLKKMGRLKIFHKK